MKAGLQRARSRAGWVLRIEQAWPAILPAAALLGVYALLCLLTLPQRLGLVAHVALLLLLAASCALLLDRRLRRLRPPSLAGIDQRLERASRLRHQPLATLRDRPAADGMAADPFWQAHLSRTEAGIASLRPGLRPGLPRLSLHGADRFGVGPALLAAVLLAAFLSGGEALPRLETGFWPWQTLAFGPAPGVTAWITPPDYAGRAPIFLNDPHGTYTVPEGATLSISLTGSNATPDADTMLAGGWRFAHLSDRSWTLQQPLTPTDDRGRTLRLSEAGHRLADWRLVVQALPALVVAWSAPPGADTAIPSRTALPWHVAQRYGVRRLAAEIRLQHGDPAARPLTVPIPLAGTPTDSHGVATPDLSADPWAGAAVTARLVATDGSGRKSHSADAAFVLPQRHFANPLARAVLDIRRRLATGQEPATAAADDLQALGDTPGAFASDTSLFLNLTATAALLRLPARFTEPDAEQAATQQAIGRLWTLALALEDGLHHDRATARASANLRASQDRLSAQIGRMRALGAAGQSSAEQSALKARIAELGAAIAAKMQALAAEAARQHQPVPPMPDAASLGGQALDRMLDAMQRQAAAGHGDAAMRELSQMQSMLDHMRLATPQDLRDAAEQAAANQAARDQMQAIQDLVKRQTALLDQTRQATNATDPNAPQSQTHPQAHPQSVLRRATDELATEFKTLTGKESSGLHDATEAMRTAHDALAAGQGADAATAQIKALAALNQGQQQMRQTMQSGRSGPGSLALLPGGSGAQQQGSESDDTGDDDGDQPGSGTQLGSDEDGPRDPLGRPTGEGHGGHDDGSETTVPTADSAAKSRQIEQELRRRDSDRTRPQPELDYLDRLLHAF